MKKLILISITLLLSACAQQSRLGMTPGADGNMYGSIVENNLVIDSSQFEDASIKVTIRNTSGDETLDIYDLRSKIESRLESRGYKIVPPSSKEFTVRYDINVTYSGYIRQDMRTELGVLGAAGGGIAGYRSDAKAGTELGIVAGATLGAIVGSYISDDTYITVTDVTIAIKNNYSGKTKRKITFDSSPALQEDQSSGITRFDESLSNKVAVYGGGRNINQTDVISEVKARLSRILADLI